MGRAAAAGWWGGVCFWFLFWLTVFRALRFVGSFNGLVPLLLVSLYIVLPNSVPSNTHCSNSLSPCLPFSLSGGTLSPRSLTPTNI